MTYAPPAEPPPDGVEPVVEARLPFHVAAMIFLPLAALCVTAAGVGALLLYFTFTFPDPLAMRPKEAGPVIRIVGADGSVLDERGAQRDYVPLDLLPRHVPDAVMATEDRRFFEHMGLDPIGLIRALFVNMRAGRFAEGGSTLTQQLAKNLFLSADRTLARKLEEVVLALWLELKLSKRDILELYLNRVYFGGGANGIEAASRRYFGKSARELSLAEAAVMAGLLKAPSKYAPSASPVQALARGRGVLAKMRDAGFIKPEEEAAAAREDVRFTGMARNADRTGVAYAIDHVMEQLPQLDNADGSDIVVETTIDGNLQRRAAEIVARELDSRGSALGVSQGAFVALAPDGAIRALVGGRSYIDSQFNRAVKARRQPGSAFKPVVYLAAVEKGLTPDTIVEDRPLKVGGWTPRNENGRYIGEVSLRDALAQSINSVAVRLLLEVGASKVAGTARRLGIKSPLRKDASLALGTSEVSLLELAGAYDAFSSGGYVAEPYVIRRIRTSAGRVLYTRIAPKSQPTISAKAVAAMNDMLSRTLVAGTARRAALPDHPAAGKTGTSQDFRDAWFIGFTAELTGGVWVGNDDGRTMNRVMGGSLPADIWRQVMVEAHRGRPSLPLPYTPGWVAPSVAMRDRDPLDRLVEGVVAASPPIEAPAWNRSHPREPIKEDFISRALTAGTLKQHDLETASTGTGSRGSGSIIVLPPPGTERRIQR